MGNSVRVFQVDAFTSRRFAGNPAGVVLDADRLSTEDMQMQVVDRVEGRYKRGGWRGDGARISVYACRRDERACERPVLGVR